MSKATLSGHLLFENKHLTIDLDENGVISAITAGESSSETYLTPALFDQQVNGFAGISFHDPETSTEDLRKLMEQLFKQGVTRIFPTLVTDHYDRLSGCMRNIVKARESDPVLRDAFPGIHLEGPWINPDDGSRGAHPLECVTLPTWEEWTRLQDAAEGLIKLVTLAPEREGALPFIERLTDAGIAVSLGHHDASPETISAAVKAGASMVTHLGNGCKLMQHRHRSLIFSQLGEEGLTCTIIPDGHHLPGNLLRCFYKIKGSEGLMLTSDSVHIAGMAPGEYEFAGATVVLEENGHLHQKDSEIMAGSSIHQRDSVETMLKHEACSLSEAVKMASVKQAEFFDVSEHIDWKIGQSFNGMSWKYDEKGKTLQPQQVYLNGQCVHSS